MDAGSFRIKRMGIELGLFAGSRTINDDASEISQATRALCRVLASQHFEYCVHTLAVGYVFDRTLVVKALVIDAMLKAEFFHARQLFIGGGGAIHFHPKNFPDLDRRGADSAGDRMDQHARAATRFPYQPRFPVRKVSSEVVDWESRGLFGSPLVGHRP